MHDEDQHITLTQATKITPGRPSTNCLWRWCRRGVLARNGQRIRLEHVRMGGKIFTTPRWVETFGQALADADRDYFAQQEQPRGDATPVATQRSLTRAMQQRQSAHQRAQSELEEAGL